MAYYRDIVLLKKFDEHLKKLGVSKDLVKNLLGTNQI